MGHYKFDVLVIGCGIAGLSAVIKLAEQGLQVGVLSREMSPEITNTYYAQGGIIYPQAHDEKLVEDIDRASSYTANLKAAAIMQNNSAKILEEILIGKCHTNFSKDKDGKLELTKEAAHSVSRIIFKGDYTGKEIQISLLNYINDKERFPNVSILAGHTAIDLLTPAHHGVSLKQRYESPAVVGAYVFNQVSREVHKVMAKQTILATGGIGALYLHHSNAEGARGDGHAMAKRAGAMLLNMEFIQFHPTTFYDKSGHRRFLISETLRGEGAILLNSRGERFMEKYHPDLELAPRDVVSRAIAQEIIETNHECVYLDISSKNKDWIIQRFPTIYKHCKQHEIDISKKAIPVVPAAHYTCGGVKTDLNGRTTLSNLYAVGEVACTGIHGANRLASTSLLEGLTWGYIAALNICENIEAISHYSDIHIKDWKEEHGEVDSALIQQDWLTLKQTMWNYVGLVRSENRLKRAEAMFSELFFEIQRFYNKASINDELIGLKNAAEVGLCVIKASGLNSDSIGCFYRKN